MVVYRQLRKKEREDNMLKQVTRIENEEPSNPEQKLWRAVLSQAFEDAWGPDRYEKTKEDKLDALHFLKNRNESFTFVCESAGFDPSFVKRKVNKKFVENFLSAISTHSLKVRNHDR